MNDRKPRSRRGRAFARPARTACLILLPVIAVLALCGTSFAATETATWVKNGIEMSEKTEAATWKGSVRLNLYLDEGINYYIRCDDTVTGTVKPKGAGEMTKWTFSYCVKIGGTEQCLKPMLEVGHIPWATTLTVLGGIIDNQLPSNSTISLKCGGNTVETCYHLPKEILENGASGVKASYNESKEKLECTSGRLEESSLEGSQEITLVSGGVLSVKTVKHE